MRYQWVSAKTLPLLDISTIGFSADPDITQWGPGTRNQYIIHYVTEGKGYFNGICVKAGQGFLIRPGMQQEYHPDAENPWAFLWIISTDERMADLFSLFSADPETGVFSYAFYSVLIGISNQLKHEGSRVISQAQMLEIFFSIFKNHNDQSSSDIPQNNAASYVEFAANYIRNYYHTPLTIDHLTHLLGVSQPYLYKIFHAVFHQSPKQYLNGIRIQQAQKLLKETEMPIHQVGISVGYPDQLSFSKFFSSQCGQSPMHYRMSNR